MLEDLPVTYVQECGDAWLPLDGAPVHEVLGQSGHEEAARTVAAQLDDGVHDMEMVEKVRRFRVWNVGGKPMLVTVVRVNYCGYPMAIE